MGNEMILKAMIRHTDARPECQAVATGEADTRQAWYAQGREDALRDLVMVLYRTLDPQQRSETLGAIRDDLARNA